MDLCDQVRADGVRAQVAAWARVRQVPLMATAAMFVPVLAYSMLGHRGNPRDGTRLVTPTDLWNLADSASTLAQAHLNQVYVPQGALTSPPALELVLAPVVLAARATGLGRLPVGANPPVGLWLVLAPVTLVLASSVLFALDAVARRWGFSEGRRLAVGLAGALGVATVTGLWGHPEDCIAVAMVVWAALALDADGAAGAPRAALLLGVGIAFQPLAVLGVAPVLARLGWRASGRVAWRLVVPSCVVLVPPLLAEPRRTWTVLVRQPFSPRYVSFTPLTRFAPTLGPGVHGGGPTRLMAIVVAGVLAVAVCRRRHDLDTVLTMTALAFFLRVLFETELSWYYVWPVPALCLVLSLRRSPRRFAVCVGALAASMVLGDHDQVHHIALWWPALMATLVLMLAAAAPVRPRHATAPVECGAMVSAASRHD